MLPVLRAVSLGLLAVLLQWLVFSRLRLWGVFPDVVLLYVAFVAVRQGRTAGMLAGFGAGLLYDVALGAHTLGLHALLKTLMGFVIGLFRSERGEDLRLTPPLAFAGALVVALVHNGLLVIITALDQETRTLFLVFGLWIGAAVYTAFVAFVGTLFRSRPSWT
ncbi:MAG: rod shape-determining protein MreD [Rubricoccaceae bacterium]